VAATRLGTRCKRAWGSRCGFLAARRREGHRSESPQLELVMVECSQRRDDAPETRAGATAKRETWSLNFLPFRSLCDGRWTPREARTCGALHLLHAQESGEQREPGLVTCKRKIPFITPFITSLGGRPAPFISAVHNFGQKPGRPIHNFYSPSKNTLSPRCEAGLAPKRERKRPPLQDGACGSCLSG
jgi:hypothetical protein